MRLIFISHASADRRVAESLAELIDSSGGGVMTFVSSRSGDIRADAEWLPSVQRALREADTYIILLTPNSVLRPWVSFETGAAWFSNKQCVVLRAGGLTPEEIPMPLSSNQIYSLDSPADARAVFLALDSEEPPNLPQFLSEVASLFRSIELPGGTEADWEGIEHQGTFYAWAGPLLALEDKPEVVAPAQLPELLRQRGLSVRFGNRDRLSQHFGRGRSQVFATDKRTWRRPVVANDQLLLVARPEDLAK
jgi:hypothetical protein